MGRRAEIRGVLAEAPPHELLRIERGLPAEEPWAEVIVTVCDGVRRRFIAAGPYRVSDVLLAVARARRFA